MKKLTNDSKRHLEASAKKQLQNRVKRKNKTYHTKPASKPRSTGIPVATRQQIFFEELRAPVKFNLQYENCDEVVSYLARIKQMGNNGRNLNIRMDDIDEIGEGAIAMLLSVMDELSKQNVLIKGAKPKDPDVKDVLERSGFFKYMSGSVDEKNKNSKNTILRTGGVNDSVINLPEEIRKANDTVWGSTGRNPPMRGSVYEMMRNSCDHAFKDVDNIIWHLAISHDDSNNLVKFSFVDNGKGIIRSFRNGILKAVKHLFTDNVDILNTAFRNGIESRTGLSWRGKGLPTIFENYQDGYFKNLVVISNDVFIDFDRSLSKKLSVPFSGTYYFWVLNKDCVKACYT